MDIERGQIYYSKSGLSFEIIAVARHAQDCSIPMVVYRNLEDTSDSPAGTYWVLDETIFIKRMALKDV